MKRGPVLIHCWDAFLKVTYDDPQQMRRTCQNFLSIVLRKGSENSGRLER